MWKPASCRPAPARPWRHRSSATASPLIALVLETIAQYSLEQGLTPRLMKLEELFAPSMMSQ